jgi:ATP-binding cassette subfamily B protein RaxB
MQSLQPKVSTIRRKYAWVGQREEADCGVAALAMVARFHGLGVELDQLRGLVRVGDRGASLTDLQQAGTALGLRCLAARVEPGRLGQVRLPAIAHLRTGHYVVLYEVGAIGVLAGDPATGVVRLSLVSFAADWSGNLLLVQPPG